MYQMLVNCHFFHQKLHSEVGDIVGLISASPKPSRPTHSRHSVNVQMGESILTNYINTSDILAGLKTHIRLFICQYFEKGPKPFLY